MLWRIEIVRVFRGASVRGIVKLLQRNSLQRELCGINSAAEVPCRETVREFALKVAREPELSWWVRVLRAHEPRERGRWTLSAVLDQIWVALDWGDLVAALDRSGKPGRTGYAAESMLRMLIAMAYFGIPTYVRMAGKLRSNAELAHWAGFCNGRTPDETTISRFENKVRACLGLLLQSSHRMVRELSFWRPEFGEGVAVDATFIQAWSRYHKEHPADPDASAGYRRNNRQGKPEADFGYKGYVATSIFRNLPICGFLLPAGHNESPMLPALVSQVLDAMSALPEWVSGDKGYDSRANHEFLAGAGVLAAIDIREMRVEKKREYAVGPGGQHMHYQGAPLCRCGLKMEFAGHSREAERDRRAQVWRCPGECGARLLDVEWRADPRRTPYHPRDTEEYQAMKRAHQAVERNNAFLKHRGYLVRHRVRGLAKLELRLQLGVMTRQAHALAACRDGRDRDIGRLPDFVP